MSVLSYNEIIIKKIIIWDNEPCIVLSSHVFRKQKGKPVNVTKLKSLISGRVIEQTFHSNDIAEEADIETRQVVFIYENRGMYWFTLPGKPSERFSLTQDVVGDAMRFVKPNTTIDAIVFEDVIISLKIPIKMELTVTEAMTAVRGNTSSNATKEVVLETGATIQAPMFISEGDTIRVNTETGEYAERVEKA